MRFGGVAWGSTLLALIALRQLGVLAGGGLLAGLILGVLVVLRCRRVRLGPLVRRAALGLLLVATAASLVVLWRWVPLAGDPLTARADGRSRVTALVVLTSDPQSRSGRTSGSRRADDAWAVDGAVLGWAAPGSSPTGSDLPVRVLTSRDISALLPGTTVRVTARVLPAEHLLGRAVTLVAQDIDVVASAPAVQQAAGVVRAALRDAVAGRPADQAGLVPGLVVGDTSGVPSDLDQAMRDSGLAHLTAVSGGNVAVVVLVVLGAVRLAGLRRGRIQVLVVALGVAAYVVLARPEPSVVRAAGMAGVVLLAVLVDARVRALDALGMSVGALVLLDPFLSLSVGFAMSVLATAALVLLAERWAPAEPGAGLARRLARVVLALVAVSAAAQLAVAPLVVGIGGGVPVGGLVANLLAAPAVAPATALGLVAAVVGVVAPPLASVVALPACWAVGWVALVARFTADRAGVLPWPAGWEGALSLTAVLALASAALLLARRTSPVVLRGAVAILLAGGVLLLSPPTAVPRGAAWPPPGWQVVMCDVGQGDAVVLAAGPGSAVVVDAGPDPRTVDRCLTRLGITRVPIVVLTHFHADHVEGLPGVLRGRSVGVVVVSPLAEPAGEEVRVRRWLAPTGTPVRVAGAGDRWTVGELGLRVVWPTRLLRGQGSDPNNASVTLVGSVDGTSVLLGGDLEPAAQEAVLASGLVGRVDVVKVPHHGSPKQAPGWVRGAAARIGLIGVGLDNDYGHPAPATLAAYRAAGVLVGRTDLDGDVAVVRDAAGTLGLVRRGR